MAAEDELGRNGEDIFHGLVRKAVLTHGTGQVVTEDAEVYLALAMRFATSTPTDHCSNGDWAYEHTEESPLIKPLSELLPVGLKLAVSTMTLGESALVHVDPLLGFGEAGLSYGDEKTQLVPGGAELLYKVCLLRWIPMELTKGLQISGGLRYDRMPVIQNKLAHAKQLLAKGSKSASGLRLLNQVIHMLTAMRIDAELKPEHNDERTQLLFDVLKCASTVAMDFGFYKLAVTYGRRVVEMDAKSASGHFVLSRAYFALGHTSSAKRFALTAHLLDLSNTTYENQLQEIERHNALLGEDYDDDDDDDTNYSERLAELITDRQSEKKRATLKEIEKCIAEQVKHGARSILIQGGFPDELIDEIRNRLTAYNKGLSSVIIRPIASGLEILIH